MFCDPSRTSCVRQKRPTFGARLDIALTPINQYADNIGAQIGGCLNVPCRPLSVRLADTVLDCFFRRVGGFGILAVLVIASNGLLHG